MREPVESILRQFEALLAKLDPTSVEMLQDRDYAVQLADCVARAYLMLNNGMCEAVDVCRSCAGERDYLRGAMERLETIGETGEVDAAVKRFYFDFIARLDTIRRRIEMLLSQR